MMRFVTSDTHFLDQHLLGVDDFAPRPFADTEQMDEQIIEHWNAKVAENDIVYHLGDIAVYFAKPAKRADEAIFKILNALHGHLVLIKGNHDRRELFKYLAAHNYYLNGQPKFSFHDVGALIKYDHCQYYLTHYPMMLGIAPRIINLHGHIHHYAVPVKENVNVGIDSPELEYLKKRPAFGEPLTLAEVETIARIKAEKLTRH